MCGSYCPYESVTPKQCSWGSLCHTWGGRPRSSPADPDGSSFLVLDPLGQSVLLRDCLDALSCWSSAAAFCCCSGQALVWTTSWSRCAVLISSYRSTSDLVMIQMMSVKYVFSLLLCQWCPAYTLLVTQVSSEARGLN
jgi:hypothetical protein